MNDLEMHEREQSAEAKAILRGITEYNARFKKAEYRELTVFQRNSEGTVTAGLTGSTNWGWLFVRLLWVGDELRGSGLGTRLMDTAEAEALRRGCHSAWLDTFSFQARGFYEKRGYKAFGEMPEFLPGHDRIFLFKRLA